MVTTTTDRGQAMVNLDASAERLGALVRNVRDDQLDAPTPCPDYALGDLLDHIGGVALSFTAAAQKSTSGPNMQPPSGDTSRLGDDWRTRIAADLAALGAAWREPGAWDGMTYIGGMEMPAAVVGRVGLDELVVHSWDVARTTGQPFDVDPDVVEMCFEFMGPISEPGMEQQRQPAFGPVVDVPPDAPPLDRLVASTGRDPGWSPG
jgi:uncharacterized protein (TIGR03086 family)